MKEEVDGGGKVEEVPLELKLIIGTLVGVVIVAAALALSQVMGWLK